MSIDRVRPPVDEYDRKKWENSLTGLLNKLTYSGTTASRPAAPFVGQPFFDTTLGKPIWFKGPGWVDSTGSAA